MAAGKSMTTAAGRIRVPSQRLMLKMAAERRALRRSNVHKAQVAGRVLRNSQLLQEQCSSLTEMLRRAKQERNGRSGSNDPAARLGNRAEGIQEVLEEGGAVGLSDLLLNSYDTTSTFRVAIINITAATSGRHLTCSMCIHPITLFTPGETSSFTSPPSSSACSLP